MQSTIRSQFGSVKWSERTQSKIRPITLTTTLQCSTDGIGDSDKSIKVELELNCLLEAELWGYQVQRGKEGEKTNRGVVVHSSSDTQAGIMSWFDLDTNRVISNHNLATVEGYSNIVSRVLLYKGSLYLIYRKLHSSTDFILVMPTDDGKIAYTMVISATLRVDTVNLESVKFDIKQELISGELYDLLSVIYFYHEDQHRYKDTYRYCLPDGNC